MKMTRLYSLSIILLLTISDYCNSGPLTSHEWKLTDEKIKAIRVIGERIKRSQKPEVDPCSDYYEHICGNFARNEIETRRAASNKLLENNFESIFAKSNQLEAEKKLHDFLISCRDRKKQDVNQFLKDFNILENIGGWPALTPNWSGEKFDLSTAIGEMQSFTLSIVVNIAFEAADEKTRFLRVSPKRLRLLTSERQIKNLKDLLKESGIDDIDSIADSVIKFKKESMEAFKSNEISLTETDFKGLKEKVPELDWDKIIELITGKKLKDDFNVHINNIETLKKLIEIVKAIDPKITMDFIFYTFIERVHQKSIANCPEKAFGYFDQVLSRHFVESYYNDDYKAYFAGMMNSLVKILDKTSLNIFAGEKPENIMKSIQIIVEEEYLPKLKADYIEKEFEGIEIYPDKFYENSFLLRRHNMKHAYDFFFNERTDIAISIGHTIPYLMTHSLYKCHNSPSPIVLDCLSNDLVESTVGLLRHRRRYSEKFQECMQNQVNANITIDLDELFATERTLIYAHTYADWAKENPDIVEKENEIWKDYGLTSKKVVFAKIMRLNCGFQDDNDAISRLVILSHMRNLQDFSDEYNCPINSTMNPEHKCEIS